MLISGKMELLSGISNLVAEEGEDPLVMLLIASPWTILLGFVFPLLE